MPKAFLLTNKRYKIWKQIKDTFREEQRKRLLLEHRQRLLSDQFNDHRYVDYGQFAENGGYRVVDTSTDYSKYTDLTEDEEPSSPQIPSPAASPTSSSTLSTSSDESDSGYSYTTENRPVSPSIEFGLGCRPHISYFYEFMTNKNSLTPLYKTNTNLSLDQPLYKTGPAHDYQRVGQLYTPVHDIIKPLPPHSEHSEVAIPGGDNYVCLDCGKRYSTSSNLARHRQTHRASTDKKARKCPHCEKMYVSMPAYSMHVRTHSQGCECKYCGKRFSRPWLLQGHIRTHTGEKPFNCPTCAKSFADKSNLRAHIQTHSSEKPFSCVRCGKAFALKSYLYKHEESSCMRGQRFKHS